MSCQIERYITNNNLWRVFLGIFRRILEVINLSQAPHANLQEITLTYFGVIGLSSGSWYSFGLDFCVRGLLSFWDPLKKKEPRQLG